MDRSNSGLHRKDPIKRIGRFTLSYPALPAADHALFEFPFSNYFNI